MICIFCDFVNNKKECFKVWENDSFLAFLDIHPINPGHTLLIPKKHIGDVFDLEEDLYTKLFTSTKMLAPKIKKALNAPRIGVAIEGFGIDHVHVHLVPVYSGNELNPERATSASLDDLRLVQQKIVSTI